MAIDPTVAQPRQYGQGQFVGPQALPETPPCISNSLDNLAATIRACQDVACRVQEVLGVPYHGAPAVAGQTEMQSSDLGERHLARIAWLQSQVDEVTSNLHRVAEASQRLI